MEQFKDLLERVKNRNLRIDNPSSYRDLNDYMNDMIKNRNDKVKNELAYYIEQARQKIMSYYQALMVTLEKVDEIYSRVGIMGKRYNKTNWEIISDVAEKILTQTSKELYEGAKEGNFEHKKKEVYEYTEKILLYILDLLKQFRKKKM
ncbi:MAG: hypothetical protein HWN67_09170 [Candidatus Helarchaeota archaeon]|nr:hypothetical protein [Candidatus Helarchaeota archaeon]